MFVTMFCHVICLIVPIPVLSADIPGNWAAAAFEAFKMTRGAPQRLKIPGRGVRGIYAKS